IELRAAAVERLVHERAHQLHQAADRILGELGIGHMALPPGDHEHAVERPTAADLEGIAERLRIGRLTEDAMVESLAALGRPSEKLHAAVDGYASLVAGDEERERTFGCAAGGAQMIERGGQEAGDAALHVDGAAAIEHAIDDVAGERAVAPRRFVA